MLETKVQLWTLIKDDATLKTLTGADGSDARVDDGYPPEDRFDTFSTSYPGLICIEGPTGVAPGREIHQQGLGFLNESFVIWAFAKDIEESVADASDEVDGNLVTEQILDRLKILLQGQKDTTGTDFYWFNARLIGEARNGPDETHRVHEKNIRILLEDVLKVPT